MRYCPACRAALDLYLHEGVELDVCRRCGGAFLDPGEAARTMGVPAEPSSWLAYRLAASLGWSQLHCPAHAIGSAVHLHRYRIATLGTSVEVEACWQCRGLWLPQGTGHQLAQIAKQACDAAAKASEQATAARYDCSDQNPFEDARPSIASYLLQLLTGFPVEIGHPTRRPIWLVPTVVALLAVVFIVQLAVGDSGVAAWRLVPTDVIAGRNVFTLFSHSLLHADLWHFASNAYFFYVFGDNLEDHLGAGYFTGLLLVSILSAAGFHMLTCRDPGIPVLGFSGAISGVIGAYAVLFPHVRLSLVRAFVYFRINVRWYVGLWLGIQLAMGFLGVGGVAWFAHTGGFVGGAVLALWLRARSLQLRPISG